LAAVHGARTENCIGGCLLIAGTAAVEPPVNGTLSWLHTVPGAVTCERGK
jgi:hypothetical protein